MNRTTIARRARKLGSLLAIMSDLLVHRLQARSGKSGPTGLYYIVPGNNWITDRIGTYITSAVDAQFPIKAKVTSTPHLLSGQIIHYGELGAFLASIGAKRNERNQVVTTFFHGALDPKLPHLTLATERFLANSQPVQKLLTSSRVMEKRLKAWGFPAEKLVTIPLGVDLNRFQSASAAARQAARRRLSIPDNAFCIGSFQKDGVGWAEGFDPKLVKGPDIFLEVIARLWKNYPQLFILLTAPARGYIKRGLDKIGVPYRHDILNAYSALPGRYHCLDLYLITSREEGGPAAILEAMASGVAVVTSRCGMAPDILEHGGSALLSDIEDVDQLAENVISLINGPDLSQSLVSASLEKVKDYDWPVIAERCYHELYQPLIPLSQTTFQY